MNDAYVDIVNQTRLLIAEGLSAAVYTQTTDVEVEVNGLMTYDRDVVKVDLQQAAKAAGKIYHDPPEANNLVPTSKDSAQRWYYKFSEPSGDWYQPGFDPSAAGWDQGQGGFGTDFTPGSVVGTTWDSSDIWIRREFNLSKVPSEGEISLTIHHDEDAQIYINGELVKDI